MPPKPSFLSPSTSGYVCKSCLSKLRQNQCRPARPLWLARNIAHRASRKPFQPTIHTKLDDSQTTSEPVIRYWEQTPDGRRREKSHDEDQALLGRLESTLKELEKDIEGSALHGPQDAGNDLAEYDDPFLEEEDEVGEPDMARELAKELGLPQEVQEQVQMIEAQLRRKRKNPNFLNNLSEEEKASLRAELLGSISDSNDLPELSPAKAANTSLNQADNSRAIISQIDNFIIPLQAFSTIGQKLVGRLNAALGLYSGYLAENRLDFGAQRNAWRCYNLCRVELLKRPEQVPFNTWSVLWDIFEHPDEKNVNRIEHIYRLGKDMISAGTPFTNKQHILFIESWFIQATLKPTPEEQQRCIQEWMNKRDTLGRDSDEETVIAYWQLGVRMFAQTGDGTGALETVATYFNNVGQMSDLRTLIPVIRGLLVMQTRFSRTKAWHVYQVLKESLGSEMTMEDYDNVAILFLDANLEERALDVFVDMMLAGENRQTGTIQLATASRALIPDVTQKVKAEVILEDSHALAKLPARLNNQFFFGKWIKKLIGEGHLDEAMKVFELMGVRGIRPAAIHMNGLIGAFYREGPLGKQRLAEELAWKMIYERTEFVQGRELLYANVEESDLRSPVRPVATKPSIGTKDPLHIPRATIETFGILIEQYRRRQKQDLIPNLLQALKQAKIPANTSFMNQMMVTNTINKPGIWAWDVYTSMVMDQGPYPDFFTFTLLWDLLRLDMHPDKRRSIKPFTDCRNLFSQMVIQSKKQRRVGKMPQEVYDMTILTFSLAQDMPGAAVALRALQKHFNLYPTENTVRTIILQLARLGYRDPEGRLHKRMGITKKDVKERMAQVTQMLATFKEQRIEALLQEGIVFEELTGDEKSEQTLIIITDLLEYASRQRYGPDRPTPELSKRAASDMSVEDCDPWASK